MKRSPLFLHPASAALGWLLPVERTVPVELGTTERQVQVALEPRGLLVPLEERGRLAQLECLRLGPVELQRSEPMEPEGLGPTVRQVQTGLEPTVLVGPKLMVQPVQVAQALRELLEQPEERELPAHPVRVALELLVQLVPMEPWHLAPLAQKRLAQPVQVALALRVLRAQPEEPEPQEQPGPRERLGQQVPPEHSVRQSQEHSDAALPVRTLRKVWCWWTSKRLVSVGLHCGQVCPSSQVCAVWGGRRPRGWSHAAFERRL